ncbi:MAG: hypothetical protein FWF11_02405 [Coriobacteriia bacterium]|nr:hypothetical protein [Coriobacteriia bacterium]
MSLTTEEKSLLAIQDIDLKCAQIAERLDKAPHKQRIAKTRAKIAEGKQRLAAIAAADADLKQQIATLQDEAESYDQRMKIHQATLQQSSDHRAVSNLSKELEALLKQKEKCENSALQLMEKRSDLARAAEDTATKVQQLQDIEANELAAYKEYYQKLQTAAARLQQERESLLVQVVPATLTRYEKIRDSKNGIGVARYSEGKCLACSVMLPAAKQAEMEISDGIQSCPSCKRLLIVEKDNA